MTVCEPVELSQHMEHPHKEGTAATGRVHDRKVINNIFKAVPEVFLCKEPLHFLLVIIK